MIFVRVASAQAGVFRHLVTFIVTALILLGSPHANAQQQLTYPFELHAPNNPVAFNATCEPPKAVSTIPAQPADVSLRGPFRFALKPGDRWAADDAAKSRVEIADKRIQNVGERVRYSYNVFLTSLTQFKTNWTILGQWHTTAHRGMPPISFVLAGDALMVRISYQSPDAVRPDGLLIVNLARITDFPVNQWVRVVTDVTFRKDGTGWLVVTLNGERQIVNYKGPLGDRNFAGTYFKFGLYTTYLLSPIDMCLANYKRELVIR